MDSAVPAHTKVRRHTSLFDKMRQKIKVQPIIGQSFTSEALNLESHAVNPILHHRHLGLEFQVSSLNELYVHLMSHFSRVFKEIQIKWQNPRIEVGLFWVSSCDFSGFQNDCFGIYLFSWERREKPLCCIPTVQDISYYISYWLTL